MIYEVVDWGVAILPVLVMLVLFICWTSSS